jgi:tRNA-binding protein
VKVIVQPHNHADWQIFERQSRNMQSDTSSISWADFSKVDMRVGTIVHAEVFAEAKKPAYKITVDFGELGLKKSSAQITELYQTGELVGKQVIAVVNFPPKQIANFWSECLILGSVDGTKITLLSMDKPVENGVRIA